MHTLMPPELRSYGLLKFLTYQCLLIQLLNAILHVGAHFSRALSKPRDLIFTCLALPVGSIVVLTFWTVWHVMSRELIFPEVLDEFFPNWLNHSTHTIIMPVNILMSILIHHHYSSKGALLALGYNALYTVYLHIIKAQTGMFVYKYLDTFSETERLIYFACTGLFVYLMYKSGQILTNLFHGQAKPVATRKQKQK